MSARSWPKEFEASQQAVQTSNPIRKIVDHRRTPKDPNKKIISLDIGDPTKYGNMDTDKSVTNLLVKSIESNNFNGYAHSCGQVAAREAVAKYVGDNLTADDVILTSGCSGALELCIAGLANPGDNILLPRPGFSLYQTIADSKGIAVKQYNLLPEKGWEVDVAHLETLIDDKTKGILINNPSNPCGSVFSEKHLKDILEVAERHAVPIIADEIYAHMVFDKETPYIPIASLSTSVPVLSVGGLAKRYLVPGWRLGWITIHDRHDRLVAVKQGLKNLTTLILGACTLVQSILPELFSVVPQSFYDQTTDMLKLHRDTLNKGISAIPGLQCITPQGAMYMMVKIDVEMFDDSIKNDLDFFGLLLEEESVSVLPGEVFGAENFVRLVTCASVEVLQEAVQRIENFCKSHSK